jgi:hypothetical protein
MTFALNASTKFLHPLLEIETGKIEQSELRLEFTLA